PAVLELLCLEARETLSLQRFAAGEARGALIEDTLTAPSDTAAEVEEEGDGGSDLAALLRRAVGRLSKRERLVVSLRYGFTDGEPHSLQEIARLLELPLAAVEEADRRARLGLRRLVERHRALGGALVA